MAIIEKAKDVVKHGVNTYFSDTPKWAKIVRLIGIVSTSIGSAILMSNPATMPIALVVAAPYLTVIGNATALFVQGFKKN
jgi:hypothetical protein